MTTKYQTARDYINSTSCPMAAGLYVDAETVQYLEMALAKIHAYWAVVEPYKDLLVPAPVLAEQAALIANEGSGLEDPMQALITAYTAACNENAAFEYDLGFTDLFGDDKVPYPVQDAYGELCYWVRNYNGIMNAQGRAM